MNLVLTPTSGSITWLVAGSDPILWPLSTLSGWSMLNPLVYPQVRIAEEHTGFSAASFVDLEGVVNDSVLLSTSGLLFDTPESDPNSDSKSSEVRTLLEIQAPRLFARVRSLSKQANMHGMMYMASPLFFFKYDEPVQLIFPEIEEVDEAYTRSYPVETAATLAHLQEADGQGDQEPPVFAIIFLDAVRAFIQGDYRQSLLYAAIAMETAITTELDEFYSRLLTSEDSQGRFQLVPASGKDRKTSLEDPIYKLLSKRTDFSTLVDERPLYLIDKSLRLDDETLYQEARRVYNTRNSIVHSGEVPSYKQGLLRMTRDDSLHALETVSKVFAWIGLTGDYPLPNDHFVEFSPIRRSYKASLGSKISEDDIEP